MHMRRKKKSLYLRTRLIHMEIEANSKRAREFHEIFDPAKTRGWMDLEINFPEYDTSIIDWLHGYIYITLRRILENDSKTSQRRTTQPRACEKFRTWEGGNTVP